MHPIDTPTGERLAMSESLSAPLKSKLPRGTAADKDALAHVEKWMALIREFSREQPKS
jgi:hypothetical protein